MESFSFKKGLKIRYKLFYYVSLCILYANIYIVLQAAVEKGF